MNRMDVVRLAARRFAAGVGPEGRVSELWPQPVSFGASHASRRYVRAPEDVEFGPVERRPIGPQRRGQGSGCRGPVTGWAA